MVKSRKRQKNGRINGAKASQVREAIARAAFEREQQKREQDAAGSDNDDFEAPTKQSRQVRNSSTLCFIVIGFIESILSDLVVCKECLQGTLQVTVLSFSGYNAHIAFTCDNCRVEHKKWTGPKNITEAVFMAAKFAGIKLGQLGYWSKCMNMGFTNQKGQHFTVSVTSKKAKSTNEQLNIQLDEMKKENENQLHQSLIESGNKDESVTLAIDGMYPIRNNSGICVSTVMAKINGKCKILGKIIKNHSLLRIHSLQNTVNFFYRFFVKPLL